MLKRFFWATVSLLALSAPAHADFVITPIAFALFAGPLGAVASVGAIYTGVQIALYGALAIGSQLISGAFGQQQQRVDPGQYKSTFENSESSEVNAIGRVGLGGLKVFGNTKGLNRYRLIAHARGPLKAIEAFKLGGREVTIEPNGDVSSPPYVFPGGSYINWQTKAGDGTETAWADLMSTFPSLWTADHRVRGIAQSLVKYVSPGIYSSRFGKLYQGGEPEAMIVARMNHVFDPRVPGADMNDEATYVWSQNGPLCAARIMSFYPELTMASFDWDFLAEEADKADVLVPTLTGTEPRSRLSGVWLSETKRGDTMKAVLESIGAEITTSQTGLIRIRLIDDVPTPDIGFSDIDEITEWTWRSGPEAVERPNRCRVRYYSAERNYEMAEIDLTDAAWARVDDEIERYGEKILDLDYEFCPSAAQAQRNAYRDFQMARAPQGTAPTNWSGLAAWGTVHYAELALAELAEPLLVRIAPPRVDDEAAKVDIPFVEWPSALIETPWDAATMEQPAPETLPDLQFEADLAKPIPPSQAIQIVYPGGAREVRIAIAPTTAEPGPGTAPIPTAAIAEAQYRSYSGGLPNAWASMSEVGLTLGYVAADLEGQPADFRVRYFDGEQNGSYLSDALPVASVDQDNTALPAPVLTVIDDPESNDYNIEAISGPLRVAAIALDYAVDSISGGAFTPISTQNARPNQTITGTVMHALTSGDTITFRARAMTSDGVLHAAATQSFTAP